MKVGIEMKDSYITSDLPKFAIDVQPLKETTDEPSIMLQYLSQVAMVERYEEGIGLSLLLQSQDVITGFQVQNEAGEWVEAVDHHINEEMNRRVELFHLTRLPHTLHVRVQYEVPHEGSTFKGDEPLRLVFDETSIQTIEA